MRAFELFPVFLKLAERPVLVVGGGVVAASKIDALRAAGADITVVAPEVCEPIRLTGVRIVERGFEPADLDGQWLVVAAATPEVNRAVAEEAERRRLFVNAVDDPANASAYLGGVLRRDGVDDRDFHERPGAGAGRSAARRARCDAAAGSRRVVPRAPMS